MIDPSNLVFISTTIIGIILTIYHGRKSIELERPKKKLEWSDLQSCANDFSSKLIFVRISSWKNNPDAISQINGFMPIETKKWYVHIPEDETHGKYLMKT
jgi:hypothetical protein